MRKKKTKEKNLLELVPQKTKEFKEDGGRIVIFYPKYHIKFIAKKVKNPHYEIKLDNFGSFVWKQIDGNRNVEEIANKLKEIFGEKVEPVNNRVSLFIQQLVRRDLIRFNP
ncbi:MAG TPA: PqqD family protein [Thermoplasmata archaeon]|nr:PqqD family protein [Thermoplasmata archaeon]